MRNPLAFATETLLVATYVTATTDRSPLDNRSCQRSKTRAVLESTSPNWAKTARSGEIGPRSSMTRNGPAEWTPRAHRRRSRNHYGDTIVRARYDGTFDKTNLPAELVLTN